MIYHLPFLGEDIPELSPDIARVGDVVLEPPLPMLVQFINVGDDIIRRGTWLEGDALVHEGLLLGRARVTHMPTTVTLSFSDQSTHSNGSKRSSRCHHK